LRALNRVRITVRTATVSDAGVVHAILDEAAAWVRGRGDPLWLPAELDPDGIERDVRSGLYALAESEADAAGTLRFQLEDFEYWPDIEQGDSAFVHRFAVRRRYAGGRVSSAMIRWAADRARGLGRHWLRLDCDADRPRLRGVYEGFGFRHHSDRQVGEFVVSRYELPL
jgi:GNAT superfamily N-acetyltransferase